MTLMLLIAAMAGVGLVTVSRAISMPRINLSASVGRWEAEKARAARGRELTQDRSARVGLWVHDQLARRGVSLTGLRADLAITGQTVESWLAKIVVVAAAAFAFPTMVGAIAVLLFGGGAVLLSLSAALIFSGLAMGAMVLSLREQAQEKRVELLNALSTYADLLSMSLAAGRGVPESTITASRLGSGWAFGLIQDTLAGARRTGETPWEALGTLGDEVGVSELVDLASSLAMVGDSGARVRASLAARSATLRKRQLAEAEAEATKADDQMRISQLLMGFGFLILIGFPAVLNVITT